MSLQSIYGGIDRTPGQSALVETFENEVTWGRYEAKEFMGALIDGASTDTGNTGYTNILRAGLIMARYTSGAKAGKWAPWSPTDATGLAFATGVLRRSINVHDATGTDADRLTGPIVVGGGLLSSALIVPGQTAAGLSGQVQEYHLRSQLATNFFLSDGEADVPLGAWRLIQAKTADYTVLEADSGTLFTTRGATADVEFTLPATPYAGLHYGFYNVADFELLVTGGDEEVVAFNDLTADAVSFTTASEHIGGFFEVIGDGTSWLVIPHTWGLGATAQTATVVSV